MDHAIAELHADVEKLRQIAGEGNGADPAFQIAAGDIVEEKIRLVPYAYNIMRPHDVWMVAEVYPGQSLLGKAGCNGWITGEDFVTEGLDSIHAGTFQVMHDIDHTHTTLKDVSDFQVFLEAVADPPPPFWRVF
jgi:hypothetical protein